MNDILFVPTHPTTPYRTLLKRTLWSAAGACALGGLFGWKLEKFWLRIEEHPMPLKRLGPGFVGARLAHISDLHCSPLVREKYLRQCVEVINSLDVDFVAVTGDLMTGPRHYARRVAKVLGELTPKVATVACLGNHDYGVWRPRGSGKLRTLGDYLADQLTFADIFVMNNESRVFRRNGSVIQFVGVEDYWTARYDPDLAFEDAQADLPTVALCHNPDGAHDMVARGAQWVLAGHTHGNSKGQTKLANFVLPINQKHLIAGRYPLGEGRHVYVNRGLGYARRMNLNSRPEITVFTLCQEQ